MRTQQPASLEGYSVSAARWLEVRVYPGRDGLTVFFQDVTARHRAQETTAFLVEARQLLSASLDYEATLRAVASSAVPRLGDWCAVDILRDPTASTWPPELDRLAVVHADPEKIALGMTLTTRYPTDWSAAVGVPAVLRDRTPMFVPAVTDEMIVAGSRDAERAQREAERANQAKSEFLGTMSHELRTPLNAVLGYVDLLDAGVRGPVSDLQREDLGRIRRSAKVLMSLVNDVLNFARVEAGQVEFHLEPVSLDRVLGDLEALVAQPLRLKQIAYTHDSCGDGWVACADPERLKQILTNLLTNAVKFTPAGGRIAVECAGDETPAGPVLRVRVSDTGRGIPADALGRIFEPFVQIERHLTGESQQGVGLGLAIARDLARRMGGDLTVESEVGVGSTFTLSLPRG